MNYNNIAIQERYFSEMINKTKLYLDIKKIPKLMFSLGVLSFGISLLRMSGFGLDAWGTFHEGLHLFSNVSFSTISISIGIFILLLSIPFKIYPGIGTILNIITVGPLVDLFSIDVDFPIYVRFFFVGFGFLITNFGRAYYISMNLGAGPRDALYTTITRYTNVSITFSKPLLELIIILIGILMGAPIGIGLIIMTVLSGYLVNFFLKNLNHNLVEKQSTILDYLIFS
jgi:uncharacterized protein